MNRVTAGPPGPANPTPIRTALGFLAALAGLSMVALPHRVAPGLVLFAVGCVLALVSAERSHPAPPARAHGIEYREVDSERG